MKKIGLCVRYDCNNFGSMLQIFATQKVLEKMGWGYEIIRYDKRTPFFLITNVSRLFNPYFMHGKIMEYRKQWDLKKHPEIERLNLERSQHIMAYRNQYIGPYSQVYKGYRNLVKGASRYDVIMVGSDQLWTPAGIKSKFYNLLFVPEDICKISFATSFGINAVPFTQKKATTGYLSRIDHISVREKRGAEIVKELTGRDVTVALDPTLLFTGNEWREIFPQENETRESYILAYFLGGKAEHRAAVNELKKSTGLKVITIPFMDEFVKVDLDFGDERLFRVGPIEFLHLIQNAEYICTDSFHGSVFSVLNHKHFITFNRTDNDDKLTRNSRIDSLFGLLGLEERRFQKGMNVKEAIDKNIDYNFIERKLSRYRKETLLFLSQALNGI